MSSRGRGIPASSLGVGDEDSGLTDRGLLRRGFSSLKSKLLKKAILMMEMDTTIVFSKKSGDKRWQFTSRQRVVEVASVGKAESNTN
jgi:hypothetical protein